MALSNGIQVYYKFDSDTLGTDSVGSNDLSIIGATNVAGGKINNCYSFDGTNDELKTTTNPITGNGTFTVSCWVYSDADNNWRTFFAMGEKAVGKSMSVSVDGNSGGEIVLGYYGGNYLSSSIEITSATWTHIMVTHDGSTTKLYMDNVERGSVSRTNNLGTAFLSVGTWDGIQDFNGDVDEVAVWNRVLTSAERAELYNSGSGFQYPFSSGWTGKVIGVTNPAKINGIVVANILKVNGVE